MIKGIIFVDNILSIPTDFDFNQAYNMTFMIRIDACKYEITINTVII